MAELTPPWISLKADLYVAETPLSTRIHWGHCDIFFYENAPEMFDMTQL